MSDRKFIPEGQQKPTTDFEIKNGFHYYDGKLEGFTDALMRINNYHIVTPELWSVINKNNPI